MRTIKLQKLVLRDFQGGTVTLNADGNDVFIFAANAVGKTRLVSAFTWVLFYKDALGRSDFEIKNLDAQGEAAHGLEHTVEAELDVNGQIVVLKKIYREKWQKKRGSANKEFTGHTTDFFVDGVPIQEKDYISRISEIAGDESKFRLLTSPSVFPALHWQKQRALLLEVCGDISDTDVIASNEKLFPLTAILGKRTLEDHRKVVVARRSEINKEMERIPIRIDEVRRGIPDVMGIDRNEAKKEAQALETALNDAKLRLQGINTGGAIADLTKKLSGLNADLRKMEDAHRSESLSTLNRLNQQVSELFEKIQSSQRELVRIHADLKRKDGQIQIMDGDLAKLRDRWAAIDAETFKDTTVDTCPACGQVLPPERVQEAREKALAMFNQNKANQLGDVDRKGHDLKDRKRQLEKEVIDLTAERIKIETSLRDAEDRYRLTEQERNILKETSEEFSGLPHYADLSDEIESLNDQIRVEREGKAQDIERIKIEIASLESNLNYAKARVDMFVKREQGEKRIEELKIQEKTLSKEFEKLESELYLIELFIKTKVTMLTDRINSKFETVRFKLFSVLINGGIEECCQITVGGVPIDGGLNNGARINAGLEIVKVLQQHYQLKAPVFADNAEAVNNLFDVGSQMIRLYVSEDKILRVEVQNARSDLHLSEVRGDLAHRTA